MSRRWGRLEPRSGNRLEFRVVDASLARALYDGIPAARLLARTRPAPEDGEAAAAWDARLGALLGSSFDAVNRAKARHARVALDEGHLRANEATVAVLAWAVACAPDTDASLAEDRAGRRRAVAVRRQGPRRVRCLRLAPREPRRGQASPRVRGLRSASRRAPCSARFPGTGCAPSRRSSIAPRSASSCSVTRRPRSSRAGSTTRSPRAIDA